VQKKEAPRSSLDLSVVIDASPERVLKAFFDPDALRKWWQVARSVTSPRPLGPFVVEWQPTEYRDEMFGRLGGVFRGTVMQIHPGRGFFVADAFWLPPDSDPVGPMALDVTCNLVGEPKLGTMLRVSQTGCDDSRRWHHYYEVIANGWERALVSLKSLLEV